MYPMGGGGQWGQPGQQPGGYQQQPQQPNFMQSQPTGYSQQGAYMQSQQTGYPQQQQRPMQTGMGMGPQQTGFLGQQPPAMSGVPGLNRLGPAGSSHLMPQGGQQRFLSPGSGMMPQQTGMMMPQHTAMPMGMGGMNMPMRSPQPAGYLGPQPTGMMIGAQPTGYMGAQPTGMPMDPRLQLMSSQFLPATQPFSGAPTASNMNFSNASMQPANFQSSIQTLSQQQQGSREPKIPWALSKEERKSYDSIFRAWDQQGTGFISGDVAREVFGQSGIDRDSLMQIWHLSDTENRGKLNVAEFHVAMGLIYRALNGNDVPVELPIELIPPSAKDLSDSVDFLKDLLKKDTAVRSSTGLNMPEAGSNRNASYSRSQSLYQNPVAPKQDATAYKHEDSIENGGYRSSSRHLDRNTVRFKGESKADDLSEMKRQLANTQRMLDERDDDDNEDDREIDKEMEDLRFRIRRIQDDIDYFNRRGGRDAADQRRKAERELMHLMHERLPQLEKRVEEKDKRKKDRQLDESRARDRRNQDSGRRDDSSYDGERKQYDSSRSNGEYLRGSYDRREDRDRISRARDRDDYDGNHGKEDSHSQRRDHEREERLRSPPPVPNAPAISAKAAPPSPAPPPATSIAPTPPASTVAPSAGPPKNMSAEDRQAWIRSEAQRRISERMRALGASAPPSNIPDSSVEERLKAERAEADARAAVADQESAAREQARRARLEEQKLAKDKVAVLTVKQEVNEAAKGPDAPPAPILQAAREQINEDEQMIRRREETLAKEKAERDARFKKLQEEEEEARRQEEVFKERQSKFANKAAQSAVVNSLPPPSRKKAGGPPPPPPTRSRAAPAPATTAPPTPSRAVIASPSAPTISLPAITSPAASNSTNPFHRLQGAANAASPAAPTTPGGTNPFFRGGNDAGGTGGAHSPSAVVNASLPIASRPATLASQPPISGVSATRGPSGPRAPPAAHDDDWGDSDKEGEDEDDGDGPGTTTRATRQNLAQALFSSLVPTGGVGSSGRSTPTPVSAPSAPPPPQALQAPQAPPAPPGAFPSTALASTGPPDRGALLGQIAGGRRLKKAVTRDASGPPVSGKVIGDAAPPVQKYVPPPSPSPAPASDKSAGADDSFASRADNRQSVDWANSLAADQMDMGTLRASAVPEQPTVREEEESDDEHTSPEDADGHAPAQREIAALSMAPPHTSSNFDSPVAAQGDVAANVTEDFDMTRTIRVRTLYPYSGQRDEDLSFQENAIVLAHNGKDEASDWMYGTLSSGGPGSTGLFPRAYVADLANSFTARALYDFVGGSVDEASFSEGDVLKVVDQDDASWWKVEHDGAIKIAPATYLELTASTSQVFNSAPSPPNGMARSSSGRAGKEATRSEAEVSKTQFTSPVDAVQRPSGPRSNDSDREGSSDEDCDADSTTGWSSSSEDNDAEDTPGSDLEAQAEEETQEAEKARAAERMRVLEAAGLIVKSERGDAPPPPGARPAENLMLRRKTTTRRGPKPEAPARRRTIKKVAKPQRSPPVAPSIRLAPEAVREREEQMEDAYDRFTKLQSELYTVRASSSAPPHKTIADEDYQKAPSTRLVGLTGSDIASPQWPSGVTTPADNQSPDAQAELRSAGRFSSFASSLRSKAGQLTASQAERKPTPIISGPISSAAEGVGPGADAQRLHSTSISFSSPSSLPPPSASSSTWGSFVGSEALATLPDMERKRQEAIFELCQTEATHVRDLQTIIEVYYNPIQEQALLDDKARMVIFANIEDVMIAAVSFLSDLEERQRSSRLYVDHIGDILSRHIPAMKVYLPYCTNQATASQILQTERSRNQPLDALLIRLRSGAGRGLDLSSYLLTPMQRMTRYPLLIGQILRYTQEDHADWSVLKKANAIAEVILANTNERIRDNESRERLRILSQTLYVGDEARIDLTKPTRCLGDRKILKEEVLGKARSKSGRKLTLILCNDLLLILTGPNLYRMPAPLEEIVVKETSGGIKSRTEATFQIIIAGSEKISLKGTSIRACHLWMRAIEEARSECLAATMEAQFDSSRQRRRASRIG